jgi:hypothetical protein
MSSTISDVERAEMMLSLGMNDEGEPLTPEERATLEQFVADNKGPVTLESAADLEPTVGPIPSEGPQEHTMTVTPEAIQQMIASQLAQAGVGVAAQPQTVEEFLQGLDPKDSEAHLALLQHLFNTGRLQVVGTLNGGGYMMHYAEPKGTSKAGYMPGGTQGGRMVDQAVEQAKASGAKPRKTGLCDKCWSAVEQKDDGTVVSDDDAKNPVCSAGGDHTFNA